MLVRFNVLVALCLMTLLSIMLTASVGHSFGDRNDAPAEYRDGIVLIAFQDNVSEERQQAIIASIGATEIKRIGVGVHVLRVGSGQVENAINSLSSFSEVRYAEPDYLQQANGGPLPNDTNIGVQWAIQNTGQKVNGTSGTSGADERALSAWGVTTGSNAVVVAVVDTGVQYSHPDLLSNMWSNPGGVGGCAAGSHGYNVLSSNCDPMDDDTSYGGHGTHVAGIIGAVGNNGAGVAGVGWTASIMAVKWIQNNGGTAGFSSDLISALDWVVNAKKAGVNVRVVNDSATWPGTAFSQAVSDEIDLLGSNDILFVTAAGNTAQNNDTTPRYPCSYARPNMICVAASDQNDQLWGSSNFGTSTVQLAAPGVNIYSTLRQSNFGYISGTSMSAAEVSGAAALILSLGYQSVANLKATILNNVDPIAALANDVSTGGRLNLCKVVPGCSSAATGVPANSVLPVVTGTPAYGSVLGASTGVWSGVPTGYSYQWYRCNSSGVNCVAINGATTESYTALASSDIGSTLAVEVRASNSAGSTTARSRPSAVVANAQSPFGISSTIQDGATLSGSVQWQATPALSVMFVAFYVDGVLQQTDSSSPYTYNSGSTNQLDTTKLSNGTHVLGILALSNDNETYGFYGATVTVNNSTAAVQITSPANGSTVSGSVAIAVSANSSVSWVNVYIDGKYFASSPPYTFNWDSTTVANGSHTISVTGNNGSGVVGRDSVTVNVANGGPTPTPTTTPTATPTATVAPSPTPTATPNSVVKITSPANGATVSGTVNITVTASSSVTWVNVYIDGAYFASSPPFTFSWDSTKVANGSHTISVTANNGSGVIGRDSVTVNVTNGGANPSPTVTPTSTPSTTPSATPTPAAVVVITSPSNNATVSGSVNIVTQVQSPPVVWENIYIDGNYFQSSPPYTFSWNSTTVANGTHTIRADGRNSSGIVGSASISVKVAN